MMVRFLYDRFKEINKKPHLRPDPLSIPNDGANRQRGPRPVRQHLHEGPALELSANVEIDLAAYAGTTKASFIHVGALPTNHANRHIDSLYLPATCHRPTRIGGAVGPAGYDENMLAQIFR